MNNFTEELKKLTPKERLRFFYLYLIYNKKYKKKGTSEKIVDKIKSLHREGWNQREIAERFSLSQKTVSFILRNNHVSSNC